VPRSMTLPWVAPTPSRGCASWHEQRQKEGASGPNVPSRGGGLETVGRSLNLSARRGGGMNRGRLKFRIRGRGKVRRGGKRGWPRRRAAAGPGPAGGGGGRCR